MAYVSQSDKARLAVGIKKVLKKYGMQGTLRVHHHSTLICTLRKGKLDMKAGSEPNVYWIDTNYEGKIKDFYKELVDALKGEDFFDRSDPMTDYFSCSHYYRILVADNYAKI